MEIFELFKAFISSARDVREERDIAENAIFEVNDTILTPLNLTIKEIRWERLLPETRSDESIQDVINGKVDECNIFILILYKRYGTIEPGQKKSNLEKEVDRALYRLKIEKKITFLTYFRKLPENEDRGSQELKVVEFRDRLDKDGIWHKEYKDPEDFRIKLTHDLYRTVLRYKLSTKKHKSLKLFWDLGVTDKEQIPNLKIIYPPIDDFLNDFDNSKNYWFNRLIPNVVFEDFKAMQKIEKSLRLIGFRNFTFSNTLCTPSDILQVNRVWLCIPRSNQAQERLKHYEDVLRFDFKKTKNESLIRWKSSIAPNKYLNVRSPLGRYLREQRNSSVGNRCSYLSNIIAKDYAVIARFNAIENKEITMKGNLKEFFIAGIRGLGTWGAGWFIDRKFSNFNKFSNGVDFQILLEVTYKNGRISDVKDVSDADIRYFQKENSPKEIRKNINDYLQLNN